jgi:hypothetical protein
MEAHGNIGLLHQALITTALRAQSWWIVLQLRLSKVGFLLQPWISDRVSRQCGLTVWSSLACQGKRRSAVFTGVPSVRTALAPVYCICHTV